MNSKYLWT